MKIIYEIIEISGALLGLVLIWTLEVILWTIKKSFILLLLTGIVLRMMPMESAESFLSRFSAPFFEILINIFYYKLEIAFILIALFYFRNFQRAIDKYESDNQKQNMILGGLMNYLGVTDYKLDFKAEELRNIEGGLMETFKTVFQENFKAFFVSLFFPKKLTEHIIGMDPFNTELKRNEKIMNFSDDVKSIIKENAE